MLLEIEANPEQVVEEANKFMDKIEGMMPSIISFGINVLVAILIFIVGRFAIKLFIKFINKCFEKSKIEVSVTKFLESLIRAGLYVVLVVMICDQVGIETTSFIAVLGSAGLALGLAIQGSLSNFAGGVLILILKPFKVGDYIIEGTSGKEGTVKKIDLFYTYLDTVDMKKLVIPNGALANTNILNTSTNAIRKIDIEIGISYSSDIDKARTVLENTVNADESIIKKDEIFVFVKKLEESQVTMGVRAFVRNEDYWTTYFRLNEMLKKALDAASIEIPFNQLSVHIEDNTKANK